MSRGDFNMEYSIGEFSKLIHLGVHTLRYYEKEGLLHPNRNNSNRRMYSDKDIVWVDFIKRLKSTGMPIKEIKHYAKLRASGDDTLTERMKLLMYHRLVLNEQINELQEHKSKLDEKIAFYQKQIENKRKNT